MLDGPSGGPLHVDGLTDAQLHELKKRNLLKERIKNLVKSRSTSTYMMPRWRHRLLGNSDPPTELIMKGVVLFRAIVRMVINLFIRPMIVVRDRNRATRVSEMSDLSRTMYAYFDHLNAWVGKLCKVPITSLVQDTSLNFGLLLNSKAKRTKPYIEKLVQLKVRVKAIVCGLVDGEPLPEHILNFFAHHLLCDGNYFHDGFLFPSDQSRLDFNELGATRGMAEPVDEETHQRGVLQDKLKFGCVYGKYFCLERVRLLLISFLFLRILVNHIVLSPWCSEVCKKPGEKHKSSVVRNLRIVATVLYEIAQVADPYLPSLCQRDNVEVGSTSALTASPAGNEPSGFNSKIDQNRVVVRTDIESQKLSIEKVTSDYFDTINQFFSSMIRADLAVKTGDVAQLLAERLLLDQERRSPFESVESLHALLLPSQQLSNLKPHIADWVEELAEKQLSPWISDLALQILECKRKVVTLPL